MQTGLFERKDELGRVDALLALAQAGSGDMVLITGPAGIGKSVLLGVAREHARLAGMRVLSGCGRELEGGFSFGVARQLFEPLLAGAEEIEQDALLAGAARRALTALEDETDQSLLVAGTDPPFAVVHGLYWLAVNASEIAPVMLAIDDLQWADQASLRFVLYLADRLSGLPVALALGWRTGETMTPGTADCLTRLEQIAAGGVVSPGALSPDTVWGAAVRGLWNSSGRQLLPVVPCGDRWQPVSGARADRDPARGRDRSRRGGRQPGGGPWPEVGCTRGGVAGRAAGAGGQ